MVMPNNWIPAPTYQGSPHDPNDHLIPGVLQAYLINTEKIAFPTSSIANQNNLLTIGNSNYSQSPYAIYVTNNVSSFGYLRVGNGAASGANIWGGAGVPSNALGGNGDWYFTSSPGAVEGARLYFKVGGAWVATAL